MLLVIATAVVGYRATSSALDLAQHRLYAADINLAQSAAEAGDDGSAMTLLEQRLSAAGRSRSPRLGMVLPARNAGSCSASPAAATWCRTSRGAPMAGGSLLTRIGGSGCGTRRGARSRLRSAGLSTVFLC